MPRSLVFSSLPNVPEPQKAPYQTKEVKADANLIRMELGFTIRLTRIVACCPWIRCLMWRAP